MASPKNKLQEYFQKRQQPLPIYNTYQSNNADIAWDSTVILHDGRFATGNATTKVGAEQLAAQEALKLLNNKGHLDLHTVTNETNSLKNSTVSSDLTRVVNVPKQITRLEEQIKDNIVIFNEPTALLVDLENLPKIVDELPLTLGLDIYVFVGEHHPLVDKVFTRSVIRIVSPSTRKDGTDTCMQVYTGMLLAQQKYEEYLVATIDHYGAALIEMIENNTLGWVAKSGRLITRAKQLN